MSSSGTGIARAAASPSRIEIQQPAGREIAPSVREAARWFFWVVAVTAMNSLFMSIGSQGHRLTDLGAAAILDTFTRVSPLAQVMANSWMATLLLFVGFSAVEGKRSAFAIGLGLYACDLVLLVVARDFLSVPFHAFVLYQLYGGFDALGRSSSAVSA